MKDIVNDGFAKVVKPYMDAQNKKDRELIAPVEVSPAESAHSIGDQIIFNGILYNVTAQIAVDDPLSTTGAGANISLADNIETQLKNQQTQIQSVAAQAAAQSKIAQEMLAPIEEDETDASRAYEIGDQLILDGVLYDVIDDIAQHGIITPEGAGANIEEAEDITTQIKNKTVITDAVPTEGSVNPVQSGGVYTALANEAKTRGALGAKNLLPFDLAEIKALNTNGTWAGNVYTYRGVSFTVNSDGTISATGTATGGNASIKLFAASSNYEMLGKEVILTGCPSNGSASTYRIQAYRMASADGSTGTYFDDGAGTDAFTVLNDASGTVGSFAVAVYENATVTNLLFKPMVRLASDTDPTYQPYAMTNKELTPIAQAISNPNLLDNPWFTVNQRGQNTYSDATYTVDRWYKDDANNTEEVNVESGYISIIRQLTINNPRALWQKSDRILPSGTYTASIKYRTSRGSAAASGYHFIIYSGTTTTSIVNKNLPKSDGWSIFEITFAISSDMAIGIALQDLGASEGFAAIGDEIDIACIKLERGSVSTLAMDIAPNYAEELLKCQRYFFKTIVQSGTTKVTSFITSALNDTYLAGVRFPIEMRVAPTINNIIAQDFFIIDPVIDSGISAGGTKQGISYMEKSNAFVSGRSYYLQFEASADL